MGVLVTGYKDAEMIQKGQKASVRYLSGRGHFPAWPAPLVPVQGIQTQRNAHRAERQETQTEAGSVIKQPCDCGKVFPPS